MRLGIAIIPVYTHGPALLASQVLAMAHAAPGRFALGIGTSSNVIVERWNGIPFEKPYQRARDTLRFLRQALTGEKVTEQYETFEIKGFRLERGLAPAETPPILLAALRPGMLRLAGREADGAIINWLSRRRRHEGRAPRWRGQGDRGPALLLPVRGRGHRARPCQVRDRRRTSTCRSTPRSTSGSAAASS